MTITILLCAMLAMSLAMALAWRVQRATGSSGWIDTIWSAAVGLVGIGVALAPGAEPGRGRLAAALVALWSARLALHIASRTSEAHSWGAPDDPRYADLARQWGADAPRRMFWFLQSQAMAGFVLAAAVRLAAINPAPFPRLADALAVAILLVAVAGEALADAQLQKFRRAHRGEKLICEDGLWGWSRHPNYFFEWLGWFAYPIMAISGETPWGWLALGAPLLMYGLLVHVSGIPPLEAQMATSRGDAFRDLQRRVNAFFPSPPRAPAGRPSDLGSQS
jgi:steroid 5-alpha reductase family enzyme